MTHRERLLATLRYQPVDRAPDYEFGAWVQTIVRWHQEGMPRELRNPRTGATFHSDLGEAAYGSDNADYARACGASEAYFRPDEAEFGASPHLYIGPFPGFTWQVLEERGDHLVVQGEDGAIAEMLRPQLGASIPRYLRHALETKADWERIRDERLNPETPGRVPEDLDELCRQSLNADYPVALSCGGVYGWLRNWMGLENISIAVAEDPAWVGEMMTHLTDLKMSLFARLAGKCRIDIGGWWEDMCFNKGPLVSPRFFEERMVPQYRRVTEFLRRECGCEFHMVDCDGNIHQLVPGWLESGINVMWPVEVAHTDASMIRAGLGTRVAFRGGVDKRALIAGPGAIDDEMARLAPLVAAGGFIPHTDHDVPPDVSWESYCHYRARKCALIGKR